MVLTHLEAVKAVFGDLAGLILLDIGCGESSLPRDLAALGAECSGIDPLMPAYEWQSEATGRFRIVQASAEALPIADATVDGVLFVFSLHHVPGTALAGALAEARRVLTPGGRLYVAEPLAEGDFNDVLEIFHDEARVRAAAQAEMASVAGQFARHSVMAYSSRFSFDDFSAFATRMQANTRFNDYAAEDVIAPAVRERYEAIAARTGGVFDQPVKVDVFD